MKMLFRQRVSFWLDSYDIYGEDGQTLYTVRGQLAWGHCLKIFDAQGNEVGMVQQKLLTLLPQFELWQGGVCLGRIRRELNFLTPRYDIDFNGWQVEGNWLEWDYTILDGTGSLVAKISKELLHWSDTYVIDVRREGDALEALMFVLAIDAEKCSRG